LRAPAEYRLSPSSALRGEVEDMREDMRESSGPHLQGKGPSHDGHEVAPLHADKTRVS
jgi:hypothetical protein